MKTFHRGTRFFIVAGLAGLTLSLGACGYKDKPVPPQHIVPKPITDLTYQLSSKGATLTWTYPNETVTGEDLTRISNFKLYRAVVPMESYCETCPIPFLAPVSLDGGALPDKGNRSGSYQEPILRPGNMYFYKVRSNNGWWSESADSNIISFLWDTPAGAPAELRAQTADGRNLLNWTAVTRNQDGSALAHPVRYQVFRKSGAGSFVKLGAPIGETSYTDTRVQNGVTYTYQVQALSVFKKGLVEGATSTAVSVTPMDKDAPPPPETPQVVVTDAGVKVFWNHAHADDLAGYKVYRRAAGEGSARFVGQVNLPYNMYIDNDAPKGVVLYYSVSSIDSEHPANESARTAEARAEE
ncbi:MAG: hypothetical protein GX087_07080 [Desulfobulbaceae bacterium]|nr:hypothetical protein [Desulfobulbaceae bacterium]